MSDDVAMKDFNEDNSLLDEKDTLQKKNADDIEVDGVSVVEEREAWGHKCDFLLSCVGYAVGFGNVWRFPNLCYENGGGAFLIPYLIFLAVCGMPMFFMELSLSQYIGLGPISCWRAVSPLFKGIGYAMLIMSFLVSVYYNTIIAWVFYYLFESFRGDVPWRGCGNAWNSDACYDGPQGSGLVNKTITDAAGQNISWALACKKNFIPVLDNITNALVSCTYNKSVKPVLPSEEFLDKYALRISDGIHDVGEVRWELCLCLLLSWIVVYFCIWKGVESVGKVVYVTATFPYLVLFILLIRGCTLSGAGKGIVYYLTPDFAVLAKPQVWVRAASQIFYSLGIGFGSLIAMGSYNKFKNNCYQDAVIVSSINCATSIFCGFVVFSVLGHMSEVLQLPIDQVAKSGPGLVFVVYPAGISQMPISVFWSILFFLMLLTIGLDTQFAMMEVAISGISDEYPKYLRKYKEVFILVMCIFAFFVGICFVTEGGAYIVEVFNTQAGGVSLLFLAWFEVVCVGWVYGADRLQDNVKAMIGKRPGIWWTICWKYIAPVVILAVFLYGVIMWDGIKYGPNYKYPWWAEALGWLLALASMLCIPVGAAHAMWKVCKETSHLVGKEDTISLWKKRWHLATKFDASIAKDKEDKVADESCTPIV